ncbi:ThiF family adenylyltransferase [Staphylococcus gallinarum]|uniref:ThiF family adenylyltransferase n=1 Tax=Staphylococcus gallinarum TaxID=1293 RepID=UPI001E5631A1|nr:ThiF family adenylyltransferase [Staphylococcus gallinarum]MCD8828806.1 ThiF family adenylyltransferase [Staphylococcus gallinarum]MCD8902716.1 ThiF family adenylyltransferase [Staphylococcus gallinarum]MEB6055551.1 ThiF family adenylyltransferase [Staphylococcus gallinarum]
MKRYQRQAIYAPFGKHGQSRLENTHIMILGAGALGSHCAEILTRMGAGSLTIIDMDVVETSNLHRQAIFDEMDAEQLQPKVIALENKLKLINSNVKITALYQEITNNNIENLLKTYQPDIVIDGMDNFTMRFLINEACHKCQIPWIYGAAVGSKGSVYAIDYTGPCFKCLLETVPQTGESCAINGVLPPVIYQVASMEVSELLRWLSGHGFSKKLITMDSFTIDVKTLNISGLKQHQCPVCERQHYEYLNQPRTKHVEKQCGNTYLLRFNPSVFNYATLLPTTIVKQNDFAKLMTYQGYQMTLFKDGRMNVYGLDEEADAQQLFLTLNKSVK